MNASVVIPAYNEAGRIADQVRRCLELTPRPEVIVVDGASQDDTLPCAGSAGAVTLSSPARGRASQMNCGAQAAHGDLLVFLHADVLLPQRAYTAMHEALGDVRVVGGAFRRRFDHPSRLLGATCRLADLRGRIFGIYLGDQTIFVRRAVFQEIGGYPPIRLFEDVALSRRLRKRGATRLVDQTVIASGRRFRREGNLRRLTADCWLVALYFAGFPPDALARRYYPGYFDEGPRRFPAR